MISIRIKIKNILPKLYESQFEDKILVHHKDLVLLL